MSRGPVRIDFLVGTARSGTTWLGRVLGEHPDVAVFGETSYWGRFHVRPRPDGLYGEQELRRVLEIQRARDWRSTTRDDRDTLTCLGAGDYQGLVERGLGRVSPPTSPARAFRAIAEEVAASEGVLHVLEKTPHHVHWLARIADVFPEARFLVAVRDPYEFVVSLRHLQNRLDSRIDRIRDLPWRHPLLAALAWRGYMLSIERARASHGHRILEIRTSDLREHPAETVARAQEFLDLPLRELPVDLPPVNSSFAQRTRPEPRADDILWTNLVARSAMTRNGYSTRRVEFEPARLLASMLLLPVAAGISAVRLVSRSAERSLREYLTVWLGRSQG